MPFTIHEGAMKKQGSVNIMRPQEQVPDVIPENFGGTMSQGLPVRQIPFLEYPKVVYMHPNEPTQVIEHRNDRYELVGEEIVPTEHLVRVVQNEQEFRAALKEGWVAEPYVPKPVPKANSGLYGPRQAKPAK